jgi:tetratricopeptide (TPR) repeat protein
MQTLRPILFTVAVLLAIRLGHATSVALHKIDVRDLSRMSVLAREQFERGQVLFEQGDFERARELFEQVAASEPHSAIAMRQLCEALTALGRRDEAITACMGAMGRGGGSAMDFRSYVRALTSRDKLISPSDMALALVFARRARELLPDWPWGYAAQCDIATRLGDAEMFKKCLEDLKRVAPEHPETLRAQAMAASRSSGSRRILGWLVIALACLVTSLHALRGARRRSLARAVTTGLACLVAMTVTFASLTARAQRAAERAASPTPNTDGGLPTPGHLSDFEINDEDPLQHLPSDEQVHRNPLQFGYLMMDLTDRADQAIKRDDHAAAIKYWQGLAKITPERSHAFAKLCVSYEELGALDKAIYTCAAALERSGATLKDYMRYFGLVLSKPGSLGSDDVAALDKVLAHLRTDETGKGIVDELSCRLGMRLWDSQRLAPCTARLAAVRPEHPDTVYFQWALAAAQGEVEQAKRFLERAKVVAVDPDDLHLMEQETNKLATRWRTHLGVVCGLLVMVASGGGLVYLSRRRAPKAPKPTATSNVAV